MDIKKKLVGKTIVGYSLDDAGERLVLLMQDAEPVILETESEGCSHLDGTSYTWIESLDAPEALLGTVTDVEEIAMPDLGNIDGTRYKGVDEVKYYGLKITTDKGRCVIDYRNDSNGYYGGSLEIANPRRP